MTRERKKAIERASELEIVFTNNISTKNLKILIKAKEDELAADLNQKPEEPKTEEVKETVEPKSEDEKETTEPIQAVIDESKDDTTLRPSATPKEEIPPPKETSKEETTYEDEMEILRTSSCGNYKAKIISVKEAARRSGVTEKEITSSIKSGEPVNGWTFKEVE